MVWPTAPGENGDGKVDLERSEELGRLRRENRELRRALVMVRDLATAASSIGGQDQSAGLGGEGGVGLEGGGDADGGAGGDVAEVA